MVGQAFVTLVLERPGVGEWGEVPGAHWSGRLFGELQVGGLITEKPQLDRKVDLPDKELIHISNPLVSTALTL